MALLREINPSFFLWNLHKFVFIVVFYCSIDLGYNISRYSHDIIEFINNDSSLIQIQAYSTIDIVCKWTSTASTRRKPNTMIVQRNTTPWMPAQLVWISSESPSDWMY